MYYAGLDLHKRFSYVTVMDHTGKIVSQDKLPNDPDTLGDFFHSFGSNSGKIELALEAGSNWYWLYELLDDLGVRVNLAHPKKLKAIASARIKTDKIDSTILAHLLRTNLLPSSYIPTRDCRHQRELLRYRASLVRLRTMVKNKCHALLAKNGIQNPFSDLFGKGAIEYLKGLQLPQVYRGALDGYLRLVDCLSIEIKTVSKEIDQRVEADPKAQLLLGIPGIGRYSALLILSEIGDINRFPDARHLCSYAGLVPSVRSSGQRTLRGGITHEGSPWLRWILVEATQKAVQRPGPLQEAYQELLKRKGRGAAKVACARKLLKAIYHMLSKNEPFMPKDRMGGKLPTLHGPIKRPTK
ncbi:MAG TPA: IS110 family transposase [Candidatus Hypogeohydataceae bacterium YC38]